MQGKDLAALALGCALLLAAPALGGTYLGAGTAVVRGFGSVTIQGVAIHGADDGALVCYADGTFGLGGVCLPAPAGLPNAVIVRDGGGSLEVPYTLCVDNDRDGQCGPGQGACRDLLLFSHDDLGGWHNPLGGPGVLPKTYPCGPDQGQPAHWLVFLCNGAHGRPSVHAHTTSTGTAGTAWITAPSVGNPEAGFCLPGDPAAAKVYVMV